MTDGVCSCRAHLTALQAVPQHTARGGQLRAAAAALLLNRLVPAPKGKVGSRLKGEWGSS